MIKFVSLLLPLIVVPCWATISEQDKALFTQRNVLKAPGFESGIAGWTSSGGSFSATSSAGNLCSGGLTGSWDSSSAAQTLTSDSKAITSGDGLSAKTGVVSCRFKCATGTCTHTINAWDGTSNLATKTINSGTSTFAKTSVNFVMPTSGTIALRIASVASNEPQLFIDDCYLGLSEGSNLNEYPGAQFSVSGYFDTTANCNWSRTNTALGAFTADTDCPGPTYEATLVGSWQTTDTDLPKFTGNSLPPGIYKVEVIADNQNSAAGGGIQCLALNDGSTTSGRSCGRVDTGAQGSPQHVIGYFNYTTTANHTFEVYGSASANAIEMPISGSNRRLSFWVTRYPLAAQQGGF